MTNYMIGDWRHDKIAPFFGASLVAAGVFVLSFYVWFSVFPPEYSSPAAHNSQMTLLQAKAIFKGWLLQYSHGSRWWRDIETLRLYGALDGLSGFLWRARFVAVFPLIVWVVVFAIILPYTPEYRVGHRFVRGRLLCMSEKYAARVVRDHFMGRGRK